MLKDITVIFENDDVLVVNKPAGVLVHGVGSDPSGTVVEWFLSREPAALGVGEQRLNKDGVELERSGVVHRLDKDTSGVLMLVKNQDAFTHFKMQFQERLVRKEYQALVYGRMKEKWGTIDRSIGRSSKDWRRRSAERGAKGKIRESVTDWECVAVGDVDGEVFSHVLLVPKTGRMHQLRVHLKAIDHPIVGDEMYAGKRWEQSNNMGMKRLALHADKLTLELPDGTKETFEASLPEDIKNAIAYIASEV